MLYVDHTIPINITLHLSVDSTHSNKNTECYIYYTESHAFDRLHKSKSNSQRLCNEIERKVLQTQTPCSFINNSGYFKNNTTRSH